MSATYYQDGQSIDELFGVISVTKKTTKKGGEYLVVELVNADGKLSGKVWDRNFGAVELQADGVANVRGQIEFYNGQPSLTITAAAPEAGRSFEEFVPQVVTPTLVFDIETMGDEFTSLDQSQQDYLLNNLEKNEADKEVAKGKTGLHPLFGQVVSIAAMNPDTLKGTVMISTASTCHPADARFTFVPAADEKELLEKFWQIATKYQRFVTFNGNSFDFPFLIYRSAVQRIKVPIEVKFHGDEFIDLAKKITAPGGRSYKLEMIMKSLGLTNPKAEGVHGDDVAELYRAGNFKDIVDYVSRDVAATCELYELWKTYLAGKRIL